MKLITAGYTILDPNINDPDAVSALYQRIERAGRTCYKSEDKITKDSAEAFVRGLRKRGHEAMIEHATMSVCFVVDRGVSHEIVRHRLASFAQESTRYCNYSKDQFDNQIAVIEPVFFKSGENAAEKMNVWLKAMENAEKSYFELLALGATPQEARTVLPNSLKTEIVVTMNMREWRHFFKLRAAGTTGKPHPQMVEVAAKLLNECKEKMPALFDDIQAIEE